MDIKVPLRKDGTTSVPLVVTNQCAQVIYPGIETQGGTGPATQGFELMPGSNNSQTVSSDWQGRVWGRTNCSFNSQGVAQGGGPACTTGDCGGIVNCMATGQVPVTLAEFTLDGGDSQTYYDISLVDGYNIPLAIVTINPSSLPPNKGNPSCVATAGDMAPAGFNPYADGSFLGTTSQAPLAFDTSVTINEAETWCPWDLQVFPPSTPNNGVYPYPDTNIVRPAFDPCTSACAKYGDPSYCCTGAYDGPTKCKPNYYSTSAKSVCPDAYSYAYDDQTSTFITQQGPGFNIIFCPGGRSTRILAAQASASPASSGSGGTFRSASKGLGLPILDVRIGSEGGRALTAAILAISVAFLS